MPFRRWLIGSAALAIAVATATCDQAPPTANDPSISQVTIAASVHDYTRVEDRIPSDIADLDVSKLIGVSGGQISLAGHTLTVPAGAVEVPTLFTMTLVTNGYVEVGLSAVVETLTGPVDIGVSGFATPVTLTLGYARAPNVADENRLVIAKVHGSGTAEESFEIRSSTVDPVTQTVSVELSDFSRYCMMQ